VGYYPDWQKNTLPPQNILFENVTHIVHAFAWPQDDGEISYYPGMFNYGLVTATHNAGDNILLAFGGWGKSDGFAPMAADSTARANFINGVVALLSTENYDGIDLDWEFPSTITEGKNLTKLVKELRERFNQDNPDWLITMAVSAGAYNRLYIEFNQIIDYVDWIAMMGYDFHGSWTTHAGHNAPLYQPSNCSDFAVDPGIVHLNIVQQVPKQKILLGVPFYGKEFDATGLYEPITGNVNDLLFTDVVPIISDGNWEYHWDDFSKVPYLLNTDNSKFVTYDDTMSIRIKCDYANDIEVAGVMFWALGQDLVSNTQPLLETIGKSMGLITSVETGDDQRANNFYLSDNYPNPFNPFTKINYSVTETSFVILKVYDFLGREISTLVSEEKAAGTYEVEFNAAGLSSDLYFFRFTSAEYSQTKKMIVIK
jgi:chitinase